jgi:DNA processing protein
MNDELKLIYPDDFPPLLAQIPDAPKQLYIRGELPSSDWQWLAVVGSRACTNYGEQVVRYLIDGLRGYPVVIVSGMAYGIDALAHKAALDAGLPTVAVPGSGLDWKVIYPRANVNLAHEILEKGGALLSEFDPEIKAADWTFPKRNRIMAGLCRATLVIEAKEKSGSLITAKLCADYNRDLLVVPGNIFSSESYRHASISKIGRDTDHSIDDLLASTRARAT